MNLSMELADQLAHALLDTGSKLQLEGRVVSTESQAAHQVPQKPRHRPGPTKDSIMVELVVTEPGFETTYSVTLMNLPRLLIPHLSNGAHDPLCPGMIPSA